MKHALIVAVLFATAAFAAGRVSAGEDDKPAPNRPKTVKAVRYRLKIAASTMDWIHGGGDECDELWFPERKVVANVSGVLNGLPSGPVVHAFFGDSRAKLSIPGLIDKEIAPTEEVQVPAELAERIFALAELTARLDAEALDCAKKGIESGVFRWRGEVLAPKAPAPK